MKTGASLCIVVLLVAFQLVTAKLIDGFRPPAVPLIVSDPYMNIWSRGDNLTDAFPTYWSGVIKAFVGLIRIDGKAYRFMGPEQKDTAPPMKQLSVKVYATRTIYEFETAGVHLRLTFTSPLLTDDYDLLSRPVTYISFDVYSVDKQSHQVQVYIDATGEVAVNKVEEFITWQRYSKNGLQIMKIGTRDQKVFGVTGDNVGINWGYAYLSVPNNTATQVITGSLSAREKFTVQGTIPASDDTRKPRACSDDWPVMANVWQLGAVTASPVSKVLMYSYDDVYSIQYFGDSMPGYWKRDGKTMDDLLGTSYQEYNQIISRCEQFDESYIEALTKVGGDEYATMGSLIYRQTLGGMKLVWNKKAQMPWYFLKEISSDGDLSTVDVIYPASPALLYLKPELLLLQLIPIMVYGNNETSIAYPFEFAPHHLGFYPVGDIKPHEQENMPVEESANMLLMLAAVEKYSPGILKKFNVFPKYQPLLQGWVDYLTQNLPDPQNQLCTDDFLGPSPHNANLAVKGIVAIAAYAYICQAHGLDYDATKYRVISKDYAEAWVWLDIDYDQSHFKLQLYSNNTWSQKYNLLFQYIIGLDTFSPEIMKTEISYYLSKQLSNYGVPLDSRGDIEKLDWMYWIAAMGTQEQFDILNKAMYKFANETPDRVPLTDWFSAVTGRLKGFVARPVVGGVLSRLLLQAPRQHTKKMSFN